MANLPITDADDLTAAAVMHATTSSLDAAATVADLRAYFAASSSRRLAVLVDGGRYVGAVSSDGFADRDDPPDAPARDLVAREPLVAPDAPASLARDLALSTAARRVPVVDRDGFLVGIVAIDKHLASFCGTQAAG